MKSLYLDNNLYRQLKFLAICEGKPLTKLVKEFLSKELSQRLSDLPTEVIQKISAMGGSFDFLSHAEENIYDDKDGVTV